MVFRFEPFEFDVIEEVSGGSVDLVEENPVEVVSVLRGEGDEFLERSAFILLAGGFGNSPELDDLPVSPFGFPLLFYQARAPWFQNPTRPPV